MNVGSVLSQILTNPIGALSALSALGKGVGNTIGGVIAQNEAQSGTSIKFGEEQGQNKVDLSF